MPMLYIAVQIVNDVPDSPEASQLLEKFFPKKITMSVLELSPQALAYFFPSSDIPPSDFKQSARTLTALPFRDTIKIRLYKNLQLSGNPLGIQLIYSLDHGENVLEFLDVKKMLAVLPNVCFEVARARASEEFKVILRVDQMLENQLQWIADDTKNDQKALLQKLRSLCELKDEMLTSASVMGEILRKKFPSAQEKYNRLFSSLKADYQKLIDMPVVPTNQKIEATKKTLEARLEYFSTLMKNIIARNNEELNALKQKLISNTDTALKSLRSAIQEHLKSFESEVSEALKKVLERFPQPITALSGADFASAQQDYWQSFDQIKTSYFKRFYPLLNLRCIRTILKAFPADFMFTEEDPSLKATEQAINEIFEMTSEKIAGCRSLLRAHAEKGKVSQQVRQLAEAVRRRALAPRTKPFPPGRQDETSLLTDLPERVEHKILSQRAQQRVAAMIEAAQRAKSSPVITALDLEDEIGREKGMTGLDTPGTLRQHTIFHSAGKPPSQPLRLNLAVCHEQPLPADLAAAAPPASDAIHALPSGWEDSALGMRSAPPSPRNQL